jgi:hypothetical protein
MPIDQLPGSVIIDGTIDLIELSANVTNKINNAYAQANTAYGQANSAYGGANTAYAQANAAYAQANTKPSLGLVIALS